MRCTYASLTLRVDREYGSGEGWGAEHAVPEQVVRFELLICSPSPAISVSAKKQTYLCWLWRTNTPSPISPSVPRSPTLRARAVNVGYTDTGHATFFTRTHFPGLLKINWRQVCKSSAARFSNTLSYNSFYIKFAFCFS